MPWTPVRRKVNQAFTLSDFQNKIKIQKEEICQILIPEMKIAQNSILMF
jgi:hypothetical protein